LINNKINKLKEQKALTQTTNKRPNHTSYKRTENLTNIVFTDREMQLLNKGLKYNSHHKHKEWIQTLAYDADTAICLLPDKDQPYMRQLVASNIKKILNKHNILKEKRQTIRTK
jgi:hypothetical protein